jgi:hypothetical protein
MKRDLHNMKPSDFAQLPYPPADVDTYQKPSDYVDYDGIVNELLALIDNQPVTIH